MERCCGFLNSFRSITWTRTAIAIFLIPLSLILLIMSTVILLSIDQRGAVVSDSTPCAAIGKLMLKDGGSAVDAAIAMMLCAGVSRPSSCGIGGGFTAIIYSKGKFDSIVAGPTVPGSLGNVTVWDSSFLDGAKSIGVPGELKGYWEMHRKYGVLPWGQLFRPSIELCQNGTPITHWLASTIRHSAVKIENSPTMDEIFPHWQRELIMKGYKLKLPKLAKTLDVLAKEGITAFYQGDLGKDFVADIQKAGGFITMQDLSEYKVIWNDEPPMARLGTKFKMVTTPLPTHGAVSVLILNIIKNFRFHQDTPLYWHRFVEATKHAFGQSVKLGDPIKDRYYKDHILRTYKNMLDPEFAKQLRQLIHDNATFDDPLYYGAKSQISYMEGAANVCVVSPSGDAVVATTSILSHFGAYFASNRTGIIGNNLLRRFLNFNAGLANILPWNRPVAGKQSIMPYTPAIVIDGNSMPYFVISASGGAHAATLVVTAIIKYVLMRRATSDAVFPANLHNQLFPNMVEYDSEISENIVKFLKRVGHKVVRKITSFENYTSTIAVGLRKMVPDVEFSARIGGSKENITPPNNLKDFFIVIMIGFSLSVVGKMMYEVRKTFA